tara:strand:- start:26 stop:1324 length:1299 start_codon:yes stop_codon:yes gene_type:complete
MRGNSKKQQQQSFLYQGLSEQLNPTHPLYKLASKIPWDYFESEFADKYINFGRPGKPIRLMVSLLLLKQMYNQSDEAVVERWMENPYWQYFSGEEQFQWNFPCDPTELVKFRQRLGSEGVEKIFEVTVLLHGKDAEEKEVIADTTCQEKNVAFPTDTNLHLSIIKFCWKTLDKENLKTRQSYKRIIPKLLWQSRYRNTVKRRKEAISAERKLKVRAGRLLRELERNLSEEIMPRYAKTLETARKILKQKKNDKNKIYSFHAPEVSCIAKGKRHKKYEFGSKVSILMTKNSGIIVGAKNFQGNPYDGKTLPDALSQYNKIFGKYPKAVLLDEGYRNPLHLEGVEFLRVHQKAPKGYSKYRWRSRFKRRAAIEPVIGHLKSDYRMMRNYLKGTEGDEINLLLSSAAFNLRKLMQKLLFWVKFYLLNIYNFSFKN